MWSLYMLVEKTMQDVQLDWAFWTKLVVVAVGFTGGLVFMYVQCRMYFQLFRRWRAYNNVVLVQNGPAGKAQQLATDGATRGPVAETVLEMK